LDTLSRIACQRGPIRHGKLGVAYLTVGAAVTRTRRSGKAKANGENDKSW
jgi:hypothetical protein